MWSTKKTVKDVNYIMSKKKKKDVNYISAESIKVVV